MRRFFAKWGLIYPVHLLRREWVFAYRKQLKSFDSFTRNDWRNYQEEKLRSLLSWCYKNDPYYNRLFDERFDETDFIRPFDNLAQIPLATKEAISREYSRRKVNRRNLDCRSTSGSTGSPFTFYRDRVATGYMEAIQNHAYSWHGIEVGEPQGRFWGMPQGKAGQMARLKDVLKNRVRFSAFDLTTEAKYEYHANLLRFRPTYLYGYPSLILDFARFLKQEKLSLGRVPLKVVIGTGEYVYPAEREELEQLLRVPFVGEYGCSEVGVIGFDCPYGNMHLMAANVIIQIVDQDGHLLPDGEEGEVVVTELNSIHFPFIRYRLGDRGRVNDKKCKCGRALPTITISEGRKDDYIITPEGNKVYDAILAYTLKEGIVQFKAVQDRLDHLRISVITDDKFNDTLKYEYVTHLRQALKSAIDIEFVVVKEIEREKSGKLRYFKSEIGGVSRGQ